MTDQTPDFKSALKPDTGSWIPRDPGIVQITFDMEKCGLKRTAAQKCMPAHAEKTYEN